MKFSKLTQHLIVSCSLARCFSEGTKENIFLIFSTLDGPNARKLLCNLDSLQKIVPEKFQCYVECLRRFNLVRKACFGKILLDDWKQKINDFEISYRRLGISVIPKVHCVFFEIPLFIDRHQMGLGHFTTQKFESMHYDFEPTWNNFKVPENHPLFGPRLTDGTANYNTFHI